MAGAMSRNKGASFERQVAVKFRRWFPLAKRGNQCRDGADCPDVILSYTEPAYYIECKRMKAEPYPGIYRTWRKKADRERDEWCRLNGLKNIPVIIVYKYDYYPIMVLLDFDCNIPWPVFKKSMDLKYLEAAHADN